MKKLPLAALTLVVALFLNFIPACAPHNTAAALDPQFPFQNPALPMDARAADLVARMTLEEKVAQMQMDAPAIERLGIPAYHWWNEALHGIARNGPATVFPQAIGMAATFNPDLLHHVAQVIALEARAKHQDAIQHDRHGIYTGLDLWAPNINIFRDPRWGRGQETYGEDPYLTSRLAVAFVTGIQGDDPVYFQAIATPKHFAVHSGPELDRHRLNVDITQRDLWSTYLPGFEAAIREGHAYSIMGAYNRLDGLPCCANPMLLNDILRKDWGFTGFVVSDVGAITDIYANHQSAASPEEAAVMAVNAGCDLDGGTTYKSLVAAVRLNLIPESKIDQSVKRLMLGRLRLGMFDRPNTLAYAQTPVTEIDTPQHDQLAREVARQSMVLLKNTNNLLPLPKSLPTIAVIGPTADSLASLVGNYNGDPARPVTILQGIRDAVNPTTRVIYAQGSPLVSELLPLEELVPASALFTDASQRNHGLKADYFMGTALAGRPFRTRIDSQIDFDWSVPSPRNTLPATQQFSGAWTGALVAPTTGTYQLGITGAGGFRIYLDGVRILDDWNSAPRRTMGARIPLQQGESYAIRIEYFHSKDDPAIQFRWTRPEAEPFYADAVRAAQSADTVVMVLGLTAGLEREQETTAFQGFVGGDRQSLDLPAVQQELLEAVAATGKPITLVLTSGSALSINWASAHIPAILQAWYPGEEGGNAVADVLFGNYNPAGKLPITLYKSVKDLPPFDDYAMDGRTYRYFTGEPLYPFGFGLSYTTFQSSIAAVSPANPTTSDNVTVTVNVENTGQLAGDEVVQLYTARPDHPQSPLRSLQGFLRVHLKAHEKKTIGFTLTPHQLATLDDEGRRSTSPGKITLALTSTDKTPAHSFTLQGPALTPKYNYVPPKIAPF